VSRVLVTRVIDPVGVALLEKAGFDVDVRIADAPIARQELLDRVRGCAGLIPMPTDRVDGAVLDAGPLRVVANHAVGTDNVDLDAARVRGIPVTNTPGVLTEATADLALTLLLAAARRVGEGQALIREGRFHGWAPDMLVGADLNGATLGIVGLGRIGRAVADRARAFGLQVMGRTQSAGPSLETLLAKSDFLSLHCPLTPDTRHLIGAAELRAMKPTAVLVNTARGPVVDEAALVQALTEGWIAAAGLDVFEHEPRVHPGLLDLPNAVLLPHLGSATRSSRQAMSRLAAQGAIAVLTGREPAHRVA